MPTSCLLIERQTYYFYCRGIAAGSGMTDGTVDGEMAKDYMPPPSDSEYLCLNSNATGAEVPHFSSE